MRKTKIVCTIGPATEDVEVLKKLIKAVMNVERINFSHGSYEDQKVKIANIKKAREELNMPVALLLDTQGPEIRTGKLKNNRVELKLNDTIVLTPKELEGDEKIVSISYKNLYKDIKVGSPILIDDGKIQLKVKEITGKDIVCKVTNGGRFGSKKSVNIPGTHINLPALKEKDIEDLKAGCKEDFDYIAASFVRNAKDVKAIRKVLDENGGEKIKIISKIENQEGIDNIDEILELSDGVMVARGDLGVEIPYYEVPIMQKKFNDSGKLVITATQMLESMTDSPTPTRAEVSDVANAIFDVTGAIMLSGETAAGRYPVKCVETMNEIALAVEDYIKYWKRFMRRRHDLSGLDYEFSLSHNVVSTAMDMNANAILAYTETGNTPRMIASCLPACPIYALTSNEKTYRQLALEWGTTPILVKGKKKPNDIISAGIEEAKARGYVKKGDVVVIAGGASIVANMKDDEDAMNRTIGGVLKI